MGAGRIQWCSISHVARPKNRMCKRAPHPCAFVSQIWKFVVSKYHFRYTCLMQLPFKCIVDVGSFRDDLDSIVDVVGESLLEEDMFGEPVGPALKPATKPPANWRNASFGIITSQQIVPPSGPVAMFSEMLWDWAHVNRENEWFAEIIQKFECEDKVLDARAMDGRSYCLTPMQRFSAAYDNIVRSSMPTPKG